MFEHGIPSPAPSMAAERDILASRVHKVIDWSMIECIASFMAVLRAMGEVVMTERPRFQLRLSFASRDPTGYRKALRTNIRSPKTLHLDVFCF